MPRPLRSSEAWFFDTMAPLRTTASSSESPPKSQPRRSAPWNFVCRREAPRKLQSMRVEPRKSAPPKSASEKSFLNNSSFSNEKFRSVALTNTQPSKRRPSEVDLRKFAPINLESSKRADDKLAPSHYLARKSSSMFRKKFLQNSQNFGKKVMGEIAAFLN